MLEKSKWEHMKQHAFDAFASKGKLDVHELEQIIEIGCDNGEFDDKEKAVLINIISNMTRADLDDAMWTKVAELIHKFDLEHDREATIEKLDDADVEEFEGEYTFEDR
jgi:hypothetical protein